MQDFHSSIFFFFWRSVMKDPVLSFFLHLISSLISSFCIITPTICITTKHSLKWSFSVISVFLDSRAPTSPNPLWAWLPTHWILGDKTTYCANISLAKPNVSLQLSSCGEAASLEGHLVQNSHYCSFSEQVNCCLSCHFHQNLQMPASDKSLKLDIREREKKSNKHV